jgi:hypothetical protein
MASNYITSECAEIYGRHLASIEWHHYAGWLLSTIRDESGAVLGYELSNPQGEYVADMPTVRWCHLFIEDYETERNPEWTPGPSPLAPKHGWVSEFPEWLG